MARLSLLFVLLLTVGNFAVADAGRPPGQGDSVVMTQEELKFVDLVNKERASRGLSQLAVDPLLVEVARKHSREMAEKNYFSHNSPTRGIKTPMDRYLAAVKQRPLWALLGENLFFCSIVDVTRGHLALMNSEKHRNNILEGRFERIGVGAYTDRKGQFYVTQMFLAKTD